MITTTIRNLQTIRTATLRRCATTMLPPTVRLTTPGSRRSITYELPDKLVAIHPSSQRDESRLLSILPPTLSLHARPSSITLYEHAQCVYNNFDKCPTKFGDFQFQDVLRLLPKKCHVVMNESMVLSARLVGALSSTDDNDDIDAFPGTFEVLLLSPADDRADPDALLRSSYAGQVWRAMIRSDVVKVNDIITLQQEKLNDIATAASTGWEALYVAKGYEMVKSCNTDPECASATSLRRCKCCAPYYPTSDMMDYCISDDAVSAASTATDAAADQAEAATAPCPDVEVITSGTPAPTPLCGAAKVAESEERDYTEKMYADVYLTVWYIFGFGFFGAIFVGFVYTFILRIPGVLALVVWGIIAAVGLAAVAIGGIFIATSSSGETAEIAAFWKMEKKGMTDVVVPYGATEIPAKAFEGCSSLTTASIPSGATLEKDSDGDGPFYRSPTTVTRRG